MMKKRRFFAAKFITMAKNNLKKKKKNPSLNIPLSLSVFKLLLQKHILH